VPQQDPELRFVSCPAPSKRSKSTSLLPVPHTISLPKSLPHSARKQTAKSAFLQPLPARHTSRRGPSAQAYICIANHVPQTPQFSPRSAAWAGFASLTAVQEAVRGNDPSFLVIEGDEQALHLLQNLFALMTSSTKLPLSAGELRQAFGCDSGLTLHLTRRDNDTP
jgi:hypothetical protein